MDKFLLRRRWPLVVVLVAAAWAVTRAPLSPDLWGVSTLAIVLFSLPVVLGVIRWLGPRRGAALLVGLGLYALVFESVAIATGVPYGRFGYTGVLGPPLLGPIGRAHH